MQHQPRDQPAHRGNQHALPARHHFRDDDGIARLAQEEKFDRFDGVKENEVHQTAQHPHDAGKGEMQGLFARGKLFAQLKRPPPMLAEITARPQDQGVVQPGSHEMIYTSPMRFDEPFAGGPDGPELTARPTR